MSPCSLVLGADVSVEHVLTILRKEVTGGRGRLRNEEHYIASASPEIILVIKLSRLRSESRAARNGETIYAQHQMENLEIEGPRGSSRTRYTSTVSDPNTVGTR